MKLVKLSELFEIRYGNSLELNKLECIENGINFVSRTSKNNGVSARVKPLRNVEPFPSGLITVSLGGSVLESFVQPKPFYTGYHIYCLTPYNNMDINVKLYYCSCIYANKYRYNYGRQANRTLHKLYVPDISEIPDSVLNTNLNKYKDYDEALFKNSVNIESKEWSWFFYEDLFNIERGKGPRKRELDGSGKTPFVTSSDQNNGWNSYTSFSPTHNMNTISVNRNGSVAEAYYQPVPFCSTEDVHIYNPKFNMNKYIALFLVTLIKMEKYRYNYGRKWGIARMKSSMIKLPIDNEGKPDWIFMENYIKSLPFSKNI